MVAVVIGGIALWGCFNRCKELGDEDDEVDDGEQEDALVAKRRNLEINDG